ncbi:unnamed protein product, partial [Closterium sp. NIES-54]
LPVFNCPPALTFALISSSSSFSSSFLIFLIFLHCYLFTPFLLLLIPFIVLLLCSPSFPHHSLSLSLPLPLPLTFPLHLLFLLAQHTQLDPTQPPLSERGPVIRSLPHVDHQPLPITHHRVIVLEIPSRGECIVHV